MAKSKAKRSKGSKTARKTPKTSPSAKKAGAGRRAAAKSGAGASRKSARNTGRKTANAKTPRGKTARKSAAGARKAPQSKGRGRNSRQKPATAKRKNARAGGTGRERELAQTPATGRSVVGPTNPMRTIRSTGTPAGAGDSRHVPRLERERRQLRDIEESIPEPPSSLNMDRRASAARTGRAEMRQARREHTETSPAMTGGDVDADWEDAYAVGDEAPGGDNPTPDQDVVDDIGRALGVEYQDNEELKAADKITERDKHRWELDPASSEDYRDREK